MDYTFNLICALALVAIIYFTLKNVHGTPGRRGLAILGFLGLFFAAGVPLISSVFGKSLGQLSLSSVKFQLGVGLWISLWSFTALAAHDLIEKLFSKEQNSPQDLNDDE